MNGKYIIKFEQGALEQNYKVAEINLTDGVNSVFQILDEEFIATVVSRFITMNQDFNAAYQRHEA